MVAAIARMLKLLPLLLMGVSFAQPSQQERFLRTQSLYEKADYAVASNLLKELPCKGGAVWQNLGSCYAMLGDFCRARWAWKNAQRFVRRSSALRIQRWIRIICDKQLEAVPFHYLVWWFLCFSSALWLQLVLLLLFGLAIFGLGRAIIARSWLHIVFAIIATFGCLTGAFYHQAYLNAVHIVAFDTCPVRLGPGKEYPILSKLDLGTQVQVTKSEAGWSMIKQGKAFGWIEDAIVGHIPSKGTDL